MPLKNTDWSSFGPQVSPELTNQQIKSMRYNTMWYRAIVCPNRIYEKDDHNLNCTVCDGSGFLFDGGQAVPMLITSVSVRQMWAVPGRVDLGMAMITPPPEVALSWWDKVTLTETTIRYTEAKRHDPLKGPVEQLKYPIVDTDEKRGVVRLVLQTGTDLVWGTDYSVDSQGRLVFVNDPGEVYFSVMYFRRPSYIIIDMNHQARTLPSYGPRGIQTGPGQERTIEFPVMALGKLDFLVRDESKVTP